MPVGKEPQSPTWVAFAIAVIFLIAILLGVYVYRTKTQLQVQHEIMKQARGDVWRNEIREILNDPKFCAVNGCYGSERDDNSNKGHGDIKNIGKTNHSQIPLEAVQKLCSTIQDNCPRLPAVIRERRNADGLPGPAGPPGVPGPVGDIGFKGEYGREGMKGNRGDAGKDGYFGIRGDKGAPGFPGATNDGSGPQGPKGDRGDHGIPGPVGPTGDKGDRGFMIDSNGDGLIGLAGPPGAKGGRGEYGEPAMDALPGRKGMRGDRGLPCENNDTGLIGPPGPPGPPGPLGKRGYDGIRGDHGLTGLLGLPGLSGPRIKGDKGDPGRIGLPGKCECSGNGDNNWKMSKYGNQEYPGLPTRNTPCVLQIKYAPKHLGSKKDYNSWMADSSPRTDADAKKFWMTDDDNYTLFEFDNEESLLQNNPTKKYELYADFQGKAHVIYKGSLFYQTTQHKKIRVMKYHLNNQTGQVLDIPGLTPMNSQRLYNTSDNYLDFNVDENGLWVIFAIPDSTNTAVMKVDIDTMTIQYISNITLNHNDFIELFVVSGVLYGLNANTQNNAWDLYTNKAFHVAFHFDAKEELKPINVVYDYRNKQLLVFRNGKRLSYPVVCNEEEYSKKMGVSAE